MTGGGPSDVTAILKRIRDADDSGYQDLLPVVYDELRQMAAGYLRQERLDHTLQPTALVHEAYLKLVDQNIADWKDRRHFFAVAARAMRQVLIDYARRHRAAKRGGNRLKFTLDQAPAPLAPATVDLVALDDAMAELERLDARKSRVVELRFFGGLTNEEAAGELGVSPKTTEADWYMARAWLRRALGDESSA